MKTTFLTTLFSVLIALSAFSQYTESKLQRPDGVLYYYETGKGKPLLLLPSGPGFSHDYTRRMADSLKNEFRCIMIDLRGTGKSRWAKYDSTTMKFSLMIDDLEALRKQLDLPKLTILGHYFGGQLAMAYAERFPKNIEAMALVASGGVNNAYQSYFGLNLQTRLRPEDSERIRYWGDPKLIAQDRPKSDIERVKTMVNAYVSNRDNATKVTDNYKIGDFNSQVSNVMGIDKGYTQMDLLPAMQKYEGRAIVIAGRQDPLGEAVPISLRQSIKGAELIFINRCGHYPWIEYPNVFYKYLRDFLRK